MELGQIIHAKKMARHEMEECWIELETATDWDDIREISSRLSKAGADYKRFKKMYSDLTYG